MTVTATARRLGMSAVGIVSVVALTAGCSSSSAGHPVAAKSGAPLATSALTTSAAGSTPASASVPSSLPSLPSVSVSVPALGGSKFCTDFSSQGGLAGLGTTGGGVDKVLTVWDKLAAEAPSEIKPDVQAVATFLHDELNGKLDPTTATQKLTTAAQHIGTYIATHCH